MREGQEEGRNLKLENLLAVLYLFICYGLPMLGGLLIIGFFSSYGFSCAFPNSLSFLDIDNNIGDFVGYVSIGDALFAAGILSLMGIKKIFIKIINTCRGNIPRPEELNIQNNDEQAQPEHHIAIDYQQLNDNLEEEEQQIEGTPDRYICPVFKRVMKEPVFLIPCGIHNIEKEAADILIARNDKKCPCCRVLFQSYTFNQKLKDEIDQFKLGSLQSATEPNQTQAKNPSIDEQKQPDERDNIDRELYRQLVGPYEEARTVWVKRLGLSPLPNRLATNEAKRDDILQEHNNTIASLDDRNQNLNNSFCANGNEEHMQFGPQNIPDVGNRLTLTVRQPSESNVTSDRVRDARLEYFLPRLLLSSQTHNNAVLTQQEAKNMPNTEPTKSVKNKNRLIK